MKKPLILLITLFLCNLTIGQTLHGKYTCHDQYVNFSNDTADFTLSYDGSGFIYYFSGCGKYQIIDEFLVIYTKQYCKEITDFQKQNGEIIENAILAFHIEIIDKNNFRIYNLGEIKNPKKNIIRSMKHAKRKRKLNFRLAIQIRDFKKI